MFKDTDSKDIHVYLKCESRKRRGQIVKAYETFINDYLFACKTLNRDTFFNEITKLVVSTALTISKPRSQNPNYTRSDIKIFDNKI